MTEEIRGEVLHVVPPSEVDEQDLEPALAELATSRFVLVCRVGGRPSWTERLWSFVTRDPIEAVTIVTDEPAAEGEELTLTVESTSMSGVYESVDRREPL